MTKTSLTGTTANNPENLPASSFKKKISIRHQLTNKMTIFRSNLSKAVICKGMLEGQYWRMAKYTNLLIILNSA